jgi:hypothetical protein
MDVDHLAAWATIIGVPVAALAIVAAAIQLYQQKLLSRQDRMVQVYMECARTFATLHEEHVRILANPAPTGVEQQLLDRNLTSFWDLMASEYEFALVEMLPRPVFVRWFRLLHVRLHGADERVRAVLRDSWTQIGVPFAAVLSPNFAGIMDVALTQADFTLVESQIEQSWRANKSKALFKPLQ